MEREPDLSIVLEATTAQITGRCDAARNLAAWRAEAESLAPRPTEILVVSPATVAGLAEARDGVPLRALVVPGAGYYALKNAGANQARGSVVLFSDLDCRPEPGYARTLLDAFADGRVGGVAGRSVYDGESLLTRINSAHSFADLHVGGEAFERGMALAHNLALRRELYARDPWGPFAGRIGGDRYLTDALRRSGRRLVLDGRLLLHHEDVTFNLRGSVERHLRENFVPRDYGTPRQRFSAAFALACALALRPALRVKRVLASAPRFGIRVLHAPAVLLVELVYWALGLVLVSVVLAVPTLKRRWLDFQRPEAL